MEKTELERLASLETDTKNIKEDINDIKINHLPSIYRKLDGMNGKLIAILATIVSALILGIVNIIR